MSRLLLAMWLAVFMASPVAAQSMLECPARLQVAQQGTGLTAPWMAVDLDEDGSHRLVAAGLFAGSPAQRRALRPQGSEGQPRHGRYLEHFKWAEPPADGLYLVCHYEGTSVVAYQRIEPAPRRCSLETIRGPGGLAPAVARCQ